jgi:hypothetical protein
MTSEQSLVQQGRAVIDTVTARVQSDPAYAARFREEPVPALLDAGAPAEGLTDILRETGFSQEEVSGYLLALNIKSGIGPSAPGAPLPTLGSGRPGIASVPGSLADCSGTCNCSSSCLFTF